MLRSLAQWARDVTLQRKDIERIGCIGSYARGDAGPGSDVDIVVIERSSDLPFAERAIAYDTSALPVPADVLVYTSDEFARLVAESTRLGAVLRGEARWVWPVQVL